MRYIIVAPHADDEIIGCYTFLKSKLVDTVLFGTEEGMQEAVGSSEWFKFKIGFIDELTGLANVKRKTILFPDPTYELHPDHRKLGAYGEAILRAGGHVIFYSTNMSAPYIFEVPRADVKRHCLNTLYRDKQALWEYEHKYFLFEGYTKWLINPSLIK